MVRLDHVEQRVGQPGILRVGDLDVTVQVSDRRRSIRLTVERDATLTAVIPPGTGMAELTKAIGHQRHRRPQVYPRH